MNTNVYRVSLVLCVVFLIFNNLVKLAFPEMYVVVIQSDNLVALGSFVETHEWAYFICSVLFGCLTNYLYTCACVGRMLQERWRFLITAILNYVVNTYAPAVSLHFTICVMLLLPALYSANIGNVLVVYAIHGFNQLGCLSLRGLSIFLEKLNYIQTVICIADCYVWLALLVLIQINLKGSEPKWVSVALHTMETLKSSALLRLKNLRQKSQNWKPMLLNAKSSWQKPKNRLKRRKAMHTAMQELFVVAVCVVFALLSEKYVETVMFFVSHRVIRRAFDRQHHSPTDKQCRQLTVVVFSLAIIFIMPVCVSILSVVPITIAISWIGYVKAVSVDLGKETERLMDEVARLKNLVDPEWEFRQMCKDAKLTKEMEEFAVDWLFVGLHDKELIEKYQLSGENTMNSRKRRISSKMNMK